MTLRCCIILPVLTTFNLRHRETVSFRINRPSSYLWQEYSCSAAANDIPAHRKRLQPTAHIVGAQQLLITITRPGKHPGNDVPRFPLAWRSACTDDVTITADINYF